jgi:hypothetical protein
MSSRWAPSRGPRGRLSSAARWKVRPTRCITQVDVNKPARASWKNATRFGRPAVKEGAVSLRTALASLPDDRTTACAVREVVAFYAAHEHTPIDPLRLSRATAISAERVVTVVQALCSAGVLHCDGDPHLKGSSFDPDRVLAMEVDRFLRSACAPNARLQASVGRYLNRFGHT